MSETVIPKKTYLLVWVALLALLAVTVGVAYVHLGWFNPVAALSIAALKALIIILYFMHVRYSPKLIWVLVGAAFVWLGIAIGGTMSDYLTRSYLPPPTVWKP
jgi:cytochrome c oxidase subunit 4